jgi:hypothetical protein
MRGDRTSLFTRPDGRLRSAFWVPFLLFLLVAFAVAWQTFGGPP